MNFIKDAYKFLGYLSFVDIIFFAAIITLLILLVTLVYFIRINREVLDKNDFFPPRGGKKNGEEMKKNENLDPVINEIVKNLEEEEKKNNIEEYDDEEGELLDLESLTKKLKEENGKDRINCDLYEKDQEEKAIISYDELLQHHNKCTVNYEKEEVLDDVVVKKVNLNDLVNTSVQDKIPDVVVISYQKEEAFLSALQELNRLLN